MLPTDIITLIIQYCKICNMCNTVIQLIQHNGLHKFQFYTGCFCENIINLLDESYISD